MQQKFYYRELFETDYKILKFAGMWIENINKKNPKFNFLYFLILNILIYTCLTVSYAVRACNVITNVPELASNSSILVVLIFAQVNSYCFYAHRQQVNELNRLLEAEEFQMFTEEHKKIAEKRIKVWKVTRRFIYPQLLIETFLYFLTMILTDDRSLTFKDSWYPFDVTKTPYYQSVFIIHIAFAIFAFNAYISQQFLLLACFSFITIQCDLLCHNLDHVKPELLDENAMVFECKLELCIRQYAKIQRWVKRK